MRDKPSAMLGFLLSRHNRNYRYTQGSLSHVEPHMPKVYLLHIIGLSLSLALLGASPSLKAANTYFSYLPPAEVSQINIAGQEQPALVRPWEGKKKLGAAILLANAGTNPDDPALIAYLRRHINPLGWASISLMPPLLPEPPSFATAAEEISKAGTEQLQQPRDKALPKYSTEQLAEQFTAQQTYITQALNQLDSLGQAYPGKRLLIATDQSAATIIGLLHENQIPSPDILVVINPYLVDVELNEKLPKQLAELTIPVLDIVSPEAHPAAQSTSAARLSLAGVKSSKEYRQQQLQLNLVQPIAWNNCLKLIEGFAHSAIQ